MLYYTWVAWEVIKHQEKDKQITICRDGCYDKGG